MNGVMLFIQLYCQVCFPMSSAESMRALARFAPKGFQFTKAETDLLRAIEIGKVAEIGTEVPEANEVAGTEFADEARTIRSAVIEWLCMDKRAVQLFSRRGIRIRGAHISGTLDLNHLDIPFLLDFENCAFPDGIGLQHTEVHMLKLVGSRVKFLAADGLRVSGSVFLRGGFVAKEGVVLRGATIKGDLDCRDGSFGKGSDGYALAAGRATIAGSVHLVGSFRADGEVRLHIATILGDLNCTGGTFAHPDGNALNAEGADIQGRVFLCDAFNSHGTVRFVNSSVRGALECRNAVFNCHNGRALDAEGIDILGPAILVNSLFKGEVRLYGAHIRGSFVWGGVVSPNDVTLDLRFVRVRTLKDDKDSWPEKGKLKLHGLEYETLDDQVLQDAKTRLSWLGLRPKDARSHQPYEQLASVLRKQGDEEGATRVLIAKNKARKLPWFAKPMHWFLGVFVGYGYKPWRVAWISLFIVLLWACLFCAGSRTGTVMPVKSGKALHPFLWSFLTSLDTFVPLIELPAGSEFTVKAEKKWMLVCPFTKWSVSLPGSLLAFLLVVETGAGWVLVSLWITGLTGFIRP